MSLKLESLIGKLNQSTRSALQGAASLCVTRTHYDIEVEHFLSKLLEQQDPDLNSTMVLFSVNRAQLEKDLTRSLENLKTGNARRPQFSPTLLKTFTEAWTLGSVEHGASEITGSLCMLALVTNPELGRLAKEISNEFSKIPVEAFRKDLPASAAVATEKAVPTPKPQPPSNTPNLDAYTENLTEKAARGGIDPILGRDQEIRQIIDILMRRRQNNPILTGEAGVGKTAIVEGLALRIAGGEVPPPLANVSIHVLDLALLQAGAGIRGEFENRIKKLIEEVRSSPTPIILFIDEAHNLIGAGGQAGQNDAANILKPALARGELRTIAATTWPEYKKYFERDTALARRFQVVKVEEPTEFGCIVMVRGLVPILEQHHGVRVLDEAVDAAVKLSHRYIAGRQLPDKAVSVLDTACARVRLSEHVAPPIVERTKRQVEEIRQEKRALEKESANGNHDARLDALRMREKEASERLASLESRFQREVMLVKKVREVREQVEASYEFDATERLRSELNTYGDALEQVQRENPMVRLAVDAQVVSEVISAWTGIPTGNMVSDELEAMLALRGKIAERVIGQEQAIETIARRLEISRANMEDPNKPFGVFLLTGPSGVGKTETAHTLAELLYGGSKNLITINMSEFQEPHSVATLKGSPPGYIGYGEGGILTEAVRRRPYSVVLLDEAEKAHPDVLELFYQVFDQGRMEDGEGREIDFRNTLILLATSVGMNTIIKACGEKEKAPRTEMLIAALKPELSKAFRPSFLNRLEIVPYIPVRDESLKQIVKLRMERIRQRLEQNHRMQLSWDEPVTEEITRRCKEVESGARNVDSIISNTLLPRISRLLLESMTTGEKRTTMHVSMAPTGGFALS